MRVVSLVPSWTETLIEAGVNVVGRTRYCVHPKEVVGHIEVVGGTKDIDWQKVQSLNPDILIFDQEENPREFATECPFAWYSSHVQRFDDLPGEFRELAKRLAAPQLFDFAVRCERLLDLHRTQDGCEVRAAYLAATKLQQFPRILSVIRAGEGSIHDDVTLSELKASGFCFLYLIWRNPWMTVSTKSTYIGSLFEWLDIPLLDTSADPKVPGSKYPQVTLEALPHPEKIILLFSSEPFPFARHVGELKALPYASILVDGEGWSWFGIRSLLFLESVYASMEGLESCRYGTSRKF